MDSLILDALIGIGGIGLGVMSLQAAKLLKKPAAIKQKPIIHGEYIDEYLVEKDGVFVAYDPPQYVAAGVHPTIAARMKTRETGIRHSTRRVENA